MKLIKLINATYEEQEALYNKDTEEVIMTGDDYHDKIEERIEGFLTGLKYAKFDYELDENLEVDSTNELFNKCNFINEDYEDEE